MLIFFSTVPAPAKVLGDVAGAPDILPYAEDVYKYFRQSHINVA